MDIEEQYDKIYRYCYFKLYDGQLAQDMTQETFLRFYKQDLKLDNSKALPYLYTIAKNLCVDYYRKKPPVSLEKLGIEEIGADGMGIRGMRMGEAGMEGMRIGRIGIWAGAGGGGAACDESDEWIDRLALRTAMERLPKEEQELLFLRYVNEVSVASICKITGVSRFAVYRRISKALKRLKEELRKEGFSE